MSELSASKKRWWWKDKKIFAIGAAIKLCDKTILQDVYFTEIT